MKKILLYLIFLSIGQYAIGQGLKAINKMVVAKQYDKAKIALDKYLLKSKNAAKPGAWYLKGFVYNALAQTPAKPLAEIGSLNEASFSALKKYREMDPAAGLTAKEENTTLFNVYYSFSDLGIKNYAAKNYEDAYNSFVKALEVHDYIHTHDLIGPRGLRFSAHDTALVWQLVVLGNELKKTNEVLNYYKKITGADLGDEKYVEAYEAIVKMYIDGNNKPMFDKYLERARKHYPDDAYWDAMDIEFAIKGLEKEALFKKYDELIRGHPNSYMLFFNYASDLNAFTNSASIKPAEMEAYRKKIPELSKKAIAINSTTDANIILVNFYYNYSIDIAAEAMKIKGDNPEDVKKKKELVDLGKATLNQCIPYAEEAVKLFAALKEYKSLDKFNYRQVLDILSTVYKQNGDTKKAEEYEKRKAEVSKL